MANIYCINLKLAFLTTMVFVLTGCSDAMLPLENDTSRIKIGGGTTGTTGYTGTTTGGTTSGGTTGGTSGGTSGGSSGGTSGGGGNPAAPPNEASFVQSIVDQNPGMINDCVGQPIANNFLITVVRALQQRDGRWGFMKKDGGARIPRDVLAYASGSEREGTNNFFIIDFVIAGCNNLPADSNFNDPATSASVGWHLDNPNGYASHGVWSANP